MSTWIFDQTTDWHLELLGQPAAIAGFDKDVAEASIPRSDLGAAQAIATRFGKQITYVDKLEEWHVWDGRVHRPLESDALIGQLVEIFAAEHATAMAFVKEVYDVEIAAARALGTQAGNTAADQIRKQYTTFVFGEHRKYRDKIFSSAGIKNIISTLKMKVTIPSDYYNDDRQWLVVQNGVIDLNEIKEKREFPTLLPHDWDRPVTRYFEADYDPQAECPSWYQFLARSLPDVDSRRFLTKVTGAAFMAAPKLKTIPNLQGPPDSGKSLFLETMDKLGGDYSKMPSPDALLKASGTNFEQDALRNKRFVGVSEPDERAQLDDGFVKRVSGGDWTETRTLHAKSSGWYPQCVMYIASNHAVRFNTRDIALLERVSLINFPHQFLDGDEVPEELRMDKSLGEKLLAEGSGILNWLIWGMLWFLDEGIEATAQIIDNRRDAQASGSTALQWIQEFVDDGWLVVLDESESAITPNSHFIGIKDSYDQYKIWAEEAGEKYKMSRKFFSKDIQARYGTAVTSSGMRFPRLVWTQAWMDRHTAPAQGASGFSF